MAFWEELLDDDQVLPRMKQLIKEIFIPYNIDPVKYTSNKDATSTQFGYLSHSKNSNCTKSMRKLVEEPSLKALGFPAWFFYAFPDVAIWVGDGPGNEIMKKEFAHLNEETLVDLKRGKVRDKYLKRLIDLYLQFGNSLEVGITNQIPTPSPKKLVENVKSLSQFFKVIKESFVTNDSEIEIVSNDREKFIFKFPVFRNENFWGDCSVIFGMNTSYRKEKDDIIMNEHFYMRLKLNNYRGFKFKTDGKSFNKDEPLNSLLLKFQILYEEMDKKDNDLPF